MKKNTTVLVALFNSHPSVGAFHTTSDGFSFPQLTDAEAHARSLDDRTIITDYRDGEAESEHTAEKQAAFIADIKAQLATNPNMLDKKKKSELITLATLLDIEVADTATNAQIIEQLKSL